MKATELRIGNYFLDNRKLPKIMLSDVNVQVESIGEGGVNYWCAQGDFDWDFTFDEMSPIPITEEWLLKFGLKSRLTRIPTYYKNNFNIRSKRPDWITSIGISGYLFKIGYIHQLQNLYFALTGEELELKK